MNACGKLYRKSVVDKIGPKAIGVTMGEDLAFNLQLFPHLKSIFILDEVGYSYRWGGMTNKYNPKLLPDLKKLYTLKKQLIEQYHYFKAADFIRIELKNVFFSDVCQQIIYHCGDREEICNSILKELCDPVYEDIKDINNHPHVLENPFVIAMLKKDASKIYELALTKVRKERLLRTTKRLVSWGLKHI